MNQEVRKAFYAELGRLVELRKSEGAAVGTVRRWSDGHEHRKEKDGSWTDLGEGRGEGAPDGQPRESVGPRGGEGVRTFARSDPRGGQASRDDLGRVKAFNELAGLPEGTESVKGIYRHQGGSVSYELDPEVCADFYASRLRELRSAHPSGAQVSLKSPEDYAKMRLFVAADAGAVIAVDGEDLVSVCGRAHAKGERSPMPDMISAALQEGVKTADCYGTFLPVYYAQLGLQPVARLKWSQETWDEYVAGEVARGDFSKEQLDNKKVFGDWNGGEPDYVLLAKTGEKGFRGMDSVPYADDWDGAAAIRAKTLEG